MNNKRAKIKGYAGPLRTRERSGQAILLVVLAIGGAMLSATTIAGFLVNIQLQQVGDVANSAKAIFAADAGVNCALYDFNHPSAPTCFNDTGRIDLVNRANAEFLCYRDDSFAASSIVLCANQSSTIILSKGTSGTTKRAFLYTILPSGPLPVPSNTLAVTRSGGTGAGTVVSSPAGIDCGSTCVAPFPEGSVIGLTPTPAQGSIFTRWEGACSGSGACSVILNTDLTVNAVFTRMNVLTVTIARTGSGNGRVSSSDGSISNCTATCTAYYAPPGTSVTLTATRLGGSTFTGWSGACSGAGTCTLTMSSDRTVTATFNR